MQEVDGEQWFPDLSPRYSDFPTVEHTPAAIATRQKSDLSTSALPQASHQVSPALPSPKTNGGHEVNNNSSPPTAKTQPISPKTNIPKGSPDNSSHKTLPKLSPLRTINDWDDDNLLSFWRLKVIRKKGYEPMLDHFPGQTIETLHETWKIYRTRCEELGAEWRAAGKPGGLVAEWLGR